jgi:hypothetical protein
VNGLLWQADGDSGIGAGSESLDGCSRCRAAIEALEHWRTGRSSLLDRPKGLVEAIERFGEPCRKAPDHGDRRQSRKARWGSSRTFDQALPRELFER